MVNKIIISVLLVLNGIVGYLIYGSIKADVDYTEKVRTVDLAVIERLQEIQAAQSAYRDMKGEFAPDFETLKTFLSTEKYVKIKSVGDLDKDSTAGLSIDTLYIDPIKEFFTPEFKLEKLGFVPPMDTALFIMRTDFVEKNMIKVPVYEVIDPYPFNKSRTLKVGSITDAIYSGNWK